MRGPDPLIHTLGRTALVAVAVVAAAACQGIADAPAEELLRYGGMHETIGRQQHHGRVALAEILDRPHVWGVGAVAGLEGEITILDSAAVVSGVAPDGSVEPRSPNGLQATLLVGRSVGEWTDVTVETAIAAESLDAWVASAAEAAGLDPGAPFLFVVEGTVTDVRLHVINGACPVHARMKAMTLPDDERPHEREAEAVAGTVVGVHATASVGELTHPATSVHAHLVWQEGGTGPRVTGHLERFGLAPGAVLRLPATSRH